MPLLPTTKLRFSEVPLPSKRDAGRMLSKRTFRFLDFFEFLFFLAF
jgi:hypothetical protein